MLRACTAQFGISGMCTPFQWAPTLGGECYTRHAARVPHIPHTFQWAPTLGGECYRPVQRLVLPLQDRFNGHPPLGVNATKKYPIVESISVEFQWAPTLGDECYAIRTVYRTEWNKTQCFNGHPPLGVNATRKLAYYDTIVQFQWAPTLGGECYRTAARSTAPITGVFQ